MITIGIDMSLTSPGVALKRGDDHMFHLLGYQQRARDVEIVDYKLADNLRVSRLAYPALTDRWEKCDYIVQSIITWISGFIKDGDIVHIYIENYALGMSNSSSVTKLCELGGILRHAIWKRKWRFTEISPGTIKKHFTGNGRASKQDMIKAYQEKHGFKLMNDVFGISETQHPQEDMVDAVATLMTGIAGPTKKRKRVHCDVL